MSEPAGNRSSFPAGLAAMIAAAAGMASCRAGFVWAVHRLPEQGPPPWPVMDPTVRKMLLLSPFAIGALVTGISYALMRRAGAESDEPSAKKMPRWAPQENPDGRLIAGVRVFAIIELACGAFVALLSGLLGIGGDGYGMSAWATGALIGLQYGLVLAVPAGIVTALFAGRRG